MRFISLIFCATLTLCVTATAGPVENGRYTGFRGYFRSSFPNCLPRYAFVADVSNGIITFESDDRIWSGTIDQNTGQVFLPYSGVNPPPNQNVFITGPASNARMFSAYCGEGFFNLQGVN